MVGSGVELQLVFDIGIIIAAGAICAYLASLLRQPLILAYILAGILIGPLGLALVTNSVLIKSLSALGIAFLLFVVGMELRLARFKEVTAVAVAGALTQIILTFSCGFLVANYFGFAQFESIFIGLVLAFSSTMIIVKLLSEKDQLETLHGRITLGFLLVQDAAIILVLAALTSMQDLSLSLKGIGTFLTTPLAANPLLTSLVLVGGLFLFSLMLSKYVFPGILQRMSKTPEVLFLIAITVCFGFIMLAYSAGFPIAIGGFLAGVALATFPYNLQISARIAPLRDFFVTIFFVSLGMQFVIGPISGLLIPLIAFTLVVILLKPFIATLLVMIFGYEKRTAYLTGFNISQVSEFALVLAAQALILGLIGQELFSMTVLLAMVTFTTSFYLIKYEDALYRIFSPLYGLFEKVKPFNHVRLEYLPHHSCPALHEHVIVCGADRMGSGVVETLQRLGKSFVIVDHNPAVIRRLARHGVNCFYGNIRHLEVLKKLHLKGARAVVSTIPNEEDNRFLIKKVRELNPDAVVIVPAHSIDGALLFYDEGANYVVLPKFVASARVARYIHDLFRPGADSHVEELKRREIIALEKKKEQEILERHEPTYMQHLQQTMQEKSDEFS